MSNRTFFFEIPSRLLLALGVALPVVACSSSAVQSEQDAPEAAEAQAADVCDTVCGRILECDSKGDVDICSNRCQPAADQLGMVRSDVVSAALSCFTKLDCLKAQSSDSLAGCIKEQRALVSPTGTAIRFCDSLESSMAECDSRAMLDRADCLDGMKVYSDGTLQRLIGCTEKSCDVMSECISSTLETGS